jgi:hypothetical protein
MWKVIQVLDGNINTLESDIASNTLADSKALAYKTIHKGLVKAVRQR